LLQLEENHGKGFAVKTGMLAASGDLRLFADADGATPIEEYERLQQAVCGGADIVIGSRALKSTDTAVQGRLHRKIMGTVFNGIVRSMVLDGIRDSQCGFKLFRGAVAEELFSRQRIDGFGFDLEILFLARCRGYSIAEIPVNWTDITGTKVRLFRDSVRMFLDVLRVRINFMRGNYRAERALTRE
jgi:dolichyl-phosphate beta-glucosyltransferase